MLAFAALIFCVTASPVDAQTAAYEGKVIREIEYEGLVALPADTLDHYLLGRDPGELRLDVDDLNQRIRRLWERELVDDVQVAVEQVDADGVKLIVRVVERPILMSVDYVGLKRISRSDITEKIDRERIEVYESQPLSYGELERLKHAIEELYKEKGFRFAQVSYTLEAINRSQRRALFTVDEGNKVKISDIQFDGNTVYGDWRLRRTMKKTKESGLISRFTKKDIYNPASIDEDLEAVRELYRRSGYKDVLLGKPEIDVVAKNPDAPTIAEQQRRLTVNIPIEEGNRWKLGQIIIEGNEVFGDPILLSQFEKPRGGWLRSKAIDDGVEKIDKLYKSVGYIFSQIETETRDVGDDVSDLVVRIAEQDQFRVGRIEFNGNTKTRDKVLRRELFVHEGTVMNMSGIQNSLLRIRQLNYFALDEEEPVDFDFDSEKKLVDVQVKGTEAERTELQFGGGFSEFDGFFGQFSMRTNNFRGRGETLGVSLQSGSQRQIFDIEYRVPWLFDKPQNVGIRVFNQSFNTDVLTGVDFERDFSGFTATYGRSLRGFNTLSFSYSFTDISDFQSGLIACDPATDELCDPATNTRRVTTDFNFTSSSIRPTWLRNTLDSRFEPTRGLLTTASLEIAGGPLGGDTEFLRPTASLTYFKPLSRRPFRTSLGLSLEGGWLIPLNNDLAGVGGRDSEGLFPQQRFFIGGSDGSVRGFRTRTIVVREEDGTIRRDANGFPVGGTSMLQASLEYHLMLAGPFRVVFFADAGGVFAEDQSYGDFDLMRYSAGLELRVQVPLFPSPLRFILANNLDARDDDRFDSFDFSLSTSF